MGWRKDLKRKFKEQKKGLFDFSDGASSIIFWERSNGTPGTLTLDDIKTFAEEYDTKREEKNEMNEQPYMLKTYNFIFNSLGTSEYFDKYLTISQFDNIYKTIAEHHGIYAGNVVLLMLKKWNYFTEIKFWDVFNLTFGGQSDFNDAMASKVFEAMKLTSLEAIDGMLKKTQELLDTIGNLEPYRHYLMIEEIIDMGEEFTWHWSKMLDQVIDLAVNSLYEKETSEEFYSDSFANDDFDSSFEDFFEKTKTMALNDELDEAFEYFGINYGTEENEFKKIYRTLAKQFHPDLNKDPSAAIEMKKINVYKTVIENYFNQYDIK